MKAEAYPARPSASASPSSKPTTSPPPPPQPQSQPRQQPTAPTNPAIAIAIPPSAQPPAAAAQPQPQASPPRPPSKSPSASPPQPSGDSLPALRASAFGPPLTPSRDYPTSQPPPPPPFPKRNSPMYNHYGQYTSAPATSVAARLAPNPNSSASPPNQPTEQPPQPPTDRTPAQAASRGALPMGLSLENASSRILQSVHSLQRMPHGAPPNPHLSCNLLLPDGRPMALHSRVVPSLPATQERIYQPSAPPPQPSPQPLQQPAAPAPTNAEPYPQEQVAYQMSQVRDARRITRVEGAAAYPKPPAEYASAPQRNLGPISTAQDQPVAPEVYPIAHRTAQNPQTSQIPVHDPPIQPPQSKTSNPIKFIGPSTSMPPKTTPPKQPPAVIPDIQPKAPQHPAEPEPKRDAPAPPANVEINGAPAVPAPAPEEPGERRQLKVEDALHYLERVKYVFGSQPNVYNLFLDIMKAFKAQTIDTIEVIVRVSQLFQGHDQLILGFNRFLPPGYKIQIDRDEKTGVFIAGFEGPSGYSALNQTKNNILLKPIAPHPAAGPSGSVQPQALADALTNTDRVIPQPHHQPASPAGTADRLSERARPSSPRSPNRQNNANRSPRAAVRNDGDSHMADASSPARYNIIPGPLVATEQQKIEGMNMACAFLDDMQSRPDGARLFERFIEVTNEYKQGRDSEPKKAMDLCNAVTDLLAGDKDLLTKFKRFLPVFYRTATNGVVDPVAERLEGRRGGRRKNAPAQGPEALLFKRVRDALGRGRNHLYVEFLKFVHLVSHNVIPQTEFFSVIGDLFKDVPAAFDAFRNIFDKETNIDMPTDGEEEFESESEEDEVDLARLQEFKTKAISEIASESTNIVGASYRSLPKGFPQPVCSGRTPLERATLNDHWVSVTQGSEDYTAKFMRRNTYEDNLYRCEDDRYELDMIIETNASTILALEPIAATVTRLPTEAKRMHALVDGALNRIHYNAIQRIYGEKGQEVVMQVKLNPYAAIPVVLARLKEKDTHWRQARNKMNSVWRDVGEKNYYKGADHRSAWFKIADKKELSTKTLLSDVTDPTASVSSRDNEYGRTRGYTLVTNSEKEGVVNDRSRLVEAVYKASATGSGVLYLGYENDAIHRTAFELVKMQVTKEVHDAGAAKSIIRCFRKLICSFYGVSLEGDGGVSVKPKEDCPSILYADEQVYLMMRLYDILFERLSTAKKTAMKNAADQRYRNEMNKRGKERVKDKTHLPETKTHPSELVQCFTATNAMKYFSIQPLSTDGDEIFTEFVTTFNMFAQNPKTFTAEMYEEKCRVLLGPMSFIMFTLDKLLTKTGSFVIKSCTVDTLSRSYIDLYHEARSKSRGSAKQDGESSKQGNTVPAKGAVQLPNDNAQGFDAFYCSAATSALSKESRNGTTLYRFEYVRRRKPTPANASAGLLAIAVAIKLGAATDEKKRLAIQAHLDNFVGFSSSAEVAIARNGKKKGEEGGEKRGLETANEGKKGGSSTGDRGRRKRRRMSVEPLPSYKKKDLAEQQKEGRAENMSVSNGLEVEMGENGIMSFVSGEDSLINRKRRWGFDGAAKKKKRKVRKIEFASKKIANLFETDKSTEQGDAMDTESSSGSTDDEGEAKKTCSEAAAKNKKTTPTCNNKEAKEDETMADGKDT